MPVRRRQQRLRISIGNSTASHQVAEHQEVEAVQRDVLRRWRKQRGGVEDGRVRWLRDKR